MDTSIDRDGVGIYTPLQRILLTRYPLTLLCIGLMT